MIMCEVSRCLGVRSRTLQQRIESAQRPLYGHNGKRAMSSESVGCLMRVLCSELARPTCSLRAYYGPGGDDLV